jgi:hypothetical protein
MLRFFSRRDLGRYTDRKAFAVVRYTSKSQTQFLLHFASPEKRALIHGFVARPLPYLRPSPTPYFRQPPPIIDSSGSTRLWMETGATLARGGFQAAKRLVL